MDYDKIYKKFEDRISEFEKHDQLIKDVMFFIEENNSVMNCIIKSKFLAFLGNLIINFSPYIVDDCGYSYLKEALKLDENNYYAMLGICCIYDNFYTCDIVDELEYLNYIEELINNFKKLTELNKFDFLGSVRAFTHRRRDCLLNQKKKK